MLLLYFVVAGVLAGLLLRGRLDRIGAAHLRWAPVAVGGLLFQVALFSEPLAGMVGTAGPALYVASTALVLVALLNNLAHPGFALIALGALLNLAAIVANGGQMPASPEAILALTGRAQLAVEGFSNSALAGADVRLAFLGDLFVLPRPFPFANIFSIGDVLIGLGGAWFIVRTMLRRPAPVAPSLVWVGGRNGRVRTSTPATHLVPGRRGGT